VQSFFTRRRRRRAGADVVGEVLDLDLEVHGGVALAGGIDVDAAADGLQVHATVSIGVGDSSQPLLPWIRGKLAMSASMGT